MVLSTELPHNLLGGYFHYIHVVWTVISKDKEIANILEQYHQTGEENH